MLKLTYTEYGLHLEYVAAPLEVLVAQRVLLAMRTGQQLYVEPGTASFLLSINALSLPELRRSQGEQLDCKHPQEDRSSVTVIPVDDEFVEVTVQGSWMAETPEAEDGIFVTALPPQTEFLVIKLWEASQTQVTFLA